MNEKIRLLIAQIESEMAKADRIKKEINRFLDSLRHIENST